jgi:hypothetical protein
LTTNFDTAARGAEAAVTELERRGARIERETTSRGSRYLRIFPPTGRPKRAYLKTRRVGDWQTDKRRGQPRDPEDEPKDFWLFVDLASEPPEFLIAPAWWVENDLYEDFQAYIARHGGRRAFNPASNHQRITTDRIEQWRDRWDLLGLE